MNKTLLLISLVLLLLAAQTLTAWSPVLAEDMTCPDHTPVSVDIKPGSDTNPLNLSSRGVVPVAVLTTLEFDASQFTPEMAHLTDAATAMTTGCSGATAVRWTRTDVNGDRQLDLVFFFKTQDLDLTSTTTAATLMAHGVYGATTLHIMGTDSVKIVH